MATLSDTPTPTMLTSTSEAGDGGVSIKIEQGVLRTSDDDDEYDGVGSGYNAERRGIPSAQYESNNHHPPVVDNGYDNFNMYSISHSIFHSEVHIKSEPPVDIDDSHPDEESEESSSSPLKSPNTSSSSDKVPKIRLTPASKLIASPNGGVTTTTTTIDNKRRYACPYENCTKSYGKSSHLRSHLTWHTGIKPFVCKEPGCGKGFTRSDELNRHIRTHTGEKPFECAQCTKKFSRSDHLTKHLATHTKQLAASNSSQAKRIKLDKNSTAATQKSTTNTNETKNDESPGPIAKPVEAPSPPSGILKIKLEKPENSDEYKIALPAKEIKTSPIIPTLPILRPFVLKESEIMVKSEPLEETETSPTIITTITHNDNDEPDDDAIMPEANLPPLLQENTPTMTEPSAPTVKATTSLVKPAVANRLSDSVYDPTRPFPCTHCTKNFKRQDDLNRHMRTHTGEKPFACNECEKRFMRSDHLKKHMNTHFRVR